MLSVGRTQKLASGRSGRIGQTLKLKRGDDVRTLRICVFVKIIELNRVKARCDDNCAVFALNKLVFLFIVDGARSADLRANAALAGF